MTDPITSRHSPLVWPDPYAHETKALHAADKKAETTSAEAEIASLYYQSSIQSLNPTFAASTAKEAKTVNAAVEQPKSLWGQFTDWFSNLIGISKKVEKAPETSQNSTVDSNITINRPPQLEPPKEAEQKYAQSMASLNKEIIKRCEEEIEKLQEEFRTASSQKLEVLINWKFVQFALNQRDLKEQSGLQIQHELMETQKENSKLQKNYYSLLQDVQENVKTNKILRWVSIGQTVGYVGLIAVAFATGGASALISVAIPMLGLTKGATTLAQGVLQFKNDKKTGDMFMINQDVKDNTSTIQNDHIPSLQLISDDIGKLFKTLRKQIENQQKASELFTRSK